MRLDFTAVPFDFSAQRHPGDGSMEIKAGCVLMRSGEV